MTTIEWTHGPGQKGETWNPITGCKKVSEGCANCYAESIANRFWGDRKFTDVQFHPERLQQPLKWRKPRMVFVNSMSDLFHGSVTDDQLDQIFAVMALTPQHTYQVLTKRPERMLEYCCKRHRPGDVGLAADELCKRYKGVDKAWSKPEKEALEIEALQVSGNLYPGQWPLSNCWLGVTVENQKVANERIPFLLQTPAAVRFLSCEPLLEDVDLGLAYSSWDAPWNSRWVRLDNPVRGDFMYASTVAQPGYYRAYANCLGALFVDAHNGVERTTLGIKPGEFTPLGTLDWVIVGGESGPGARPCDWAWIRSIADQCREADVACFVKQAGSNAWLDSISYTEADAGARLKVTGKGGNPLEWPDPMPRQFPAVATAHAV